MTAALLALAASLIVQPALARPGEARLLALVTDTRLNEISGLADSNRHPGILWTHNDGGSEPEIYALDRQGQHRATLTLAGVRNVDWEDIAGFRDGEQDWLLIADTGDNGGIRNELTLLLVREPDSVADAEIKVERTIRFRWPDGARDCEAVAVDINERAIYLISKKRVPPELFRIPLDADTTKAPVVAERSGRVWHINQPSDSDLRRNPIYGRYRAQVSGMDISQDGRRMAVLNYLQAVVYRRVGDETWEQALQRPPVPVPFPWMAQAEAVAFSRDGKSLLIGTEILPAPLLEIRLDAP